MSEDGPAIAARVLGAAVQAKAVGSAPGRVVEGASGVTYSLVTKTNETIIAVPLSQAVEDAIILVLRPHHAWLAEETTKREKIDIQVGDAELDRRYHIEAAPSATIRDAFDEPLRAFLVAADPCRLAIVYRTLRFSRENLPLPLVERALTEVPRLADTFETLVKVAQVTPVSVDGDPYRGGLPSKVQAKRKQLADLEVKRLRWLQQTPVLSATLITTGLACIAGVVYAFMTFPLVYALLCVLLALPIWFGSSFVLYLAIAAFGALTGITGIYHRIGHRKYDALEAEAHSQKDD